MPLKTNELTPPQVEPEKTATPTPEEPTYEDLETEYAEIKFTDDEIEKAIDIQKIMPEAAVSFTVKLWGARGGEGMITIRGPHLSVVARETDNALRLFDQKYGLRPQPLQPKKSSPSAPFNPGNGGEPQEDRPLTPEDFDEFGNRIVERGTSPLHKVKVDPEGTIEYSVGNFKWAFVESRGAKKAAEAFDPKTGFSESALSKPVVYTQEEWGEPLFVDWIKIEKDSKREPGKKVYYYNVKHIHN